MKSVLTGLQAASFRNPGFRAVGFQKSAYRVMGSMVAAAMVTCSSVTVSFSKAQAAIAPLSTPTLLAQMNAADGPSAAQDASEDIPYRVLLGVALVFAVVSGVVYLRSDS